MKPLRPGDVLSGTYRIERRLHTSDRAELYIVSHTRLPRRFALKRLRIDAEKRAAVSAHFTEKAAILGRLRHPHIVDVIDWNQTPSGEPYLVMELLVGEDLGAFLRRKGAVSSKLALALGAQIGAALSAAHRVGIVHGHLEPSQIFLPRRGPLPRFVKVLDFERVESEGADPRDDQRMLATLLYSLVTGLPASPEAEMPPLPAGIVSAEVAAALLRALRRRREDRFASVDAFLDAMAISSRRLAPTYAVHEAAAAPQLDPRWLVAAVVFGLAVCSAIWALIVLL